MAYQEVTHTSYGSRLKSSFGGIATGIIMFIAATALLWWNEGRAVKTTKMLNEAQGAYVEMPDIKKVDPQFDSRLVFATGLATTKDTLVDPLFGVKDLALSMYRKVEYYQWEEHSHEQKRDKFGGGEETITTYTYEKNWTSRPQESCKFHDPQYQNSNFVLMNIQNEKLVAKDVIFGAYHLNKSQVNALPTNQKVNPTIPAETMRQIDKSVMQTYSQVSRSLNRHGYNSYNSSYDNRQNDSVPSSEFVHIADNSIYIGASPSAPSIGDVRITYTKAAPTTVSIIARVSGNTFTNYTAKNGKSFHSISVGTKTADEMFNEEHATNGMWTWALRLLGIFLAIGGLKGIFGFLETILKVIPPLAGLLGLGVRLICSVVGFVWSLLIIAIAWLFYRPLLGITLLVVGALIIFAFSKKGKKLIAQHIIKKDSVSPQTSQKVEDTARPQQAAQQIPQQVQPQQTADETWS